MNQRHIRILGLATMLVSLPVAAVNIDLVEYAFNINGVTTNGAAPAGVNLGSFDTVTGLGTVRVTQGGAGSHFVGLFVDHEFDEPVNTLFNENATVTGTAASGQSWEIDEPTGIFGIAGDIYDHLLDSTAAASALDNSNAIPAPAVEDVSMAMGWNFMLAAGEVGVILFEISELMPTSGFYLTHFDPDSNASIYLSSTLRISHVQMPEPMSLALMLAGLAVMARRRV